MHFEQAKLTNPPCLRPEGWLQHNTLHTYGYPIPWKDRDRCRAHDMTPLAEAARAVDRNGKMGEGDQSSRQDSSNKKGTYQQKQGFMW